MLLNKPRAYEIMDKYGLDGLVARDQLNVFYLTNFWGALMKMQRDFSNFALLPRQEDAPAALVISGSEMHRTATMQTWVPNLIAYSFRVKPNLRDFDPSTEEPEAEEWMAWPTREGAQLSPLEQQWSSITAEQAERAVATPAWGLKGALKDAGLERGTIGVDDPRMIHWLHEMGLPDLKGVEATNIFREIRMIKSAEEIDILRQAAIINEASCEAAIAAFREGAEWQEIETAYAVEMARRGGKSVYIVPGTGGLPHSHIRRGEPVMIDAFGEFNHYHGDIGRTAVLGEATDEMIKCNKAMQIGWETAYEMIRPGLKGSEMTQAVLDAVRKSGFPGFLIAVPHSIGLEHTDHPLPIGRDLPGSMGDMVLQENMVINVDMPYHELGWGAMHLEDTVRVTKNGCEPLTSMRTGMTVIPA